MTDRIKVSVPKAKGRLVSVHAVRYIMRKRRVKDGFEKNKDPDRAATGPRCSQLTLFRDAPRPSPRHAVQAPGGGGTC